MRTSAGGFPLLVARPEGHGLAVVASVDILHVVFALIAKSLAFDFDERLLSKNDFEATSFEFCLLPLNLAS